MIPHKRQPIKTPPEAFGLQPLCTEYQMITMYKTKIKKIVRLKKFDK